MNNEHSNLFVPIESLINSQIYSMTILYLDIAHDLDIDDQSTISDKKYKVNDDLIDVFIHLGDLLSYIKTMYKECFSPNYCQFEPSSSTVKTNQTMQNQNDLDKYIGIRDYIQKELERIKHILWYNISCYDFISTSHLRAYDKMKALINVIYISLGFKTYQLINNDLSEFYYPIIKHD